MTRLAAAVVAVLLVVGAAPAVALSPKQDARVEGNWNTTIHPVELRPPGDYSNHYVSMSLKPKCAEGPCDVILTQPTFWGNMRWAGRVMGRMSHNHGCGKTKLVGAVNSGKSILTVCVKYSLSRWGMPTQI